MTTDSSVDLVVLGLGPGGEHLATEAAKAGLSVVGVDERLVGRRVPLLRLHPLEDGDPGRQPARRGPSGRHARRVGRGRTRLGHGGRAHPRRGHRRLGRPGRGRAPREGRRPLRPRPRPARRPRASSRWTARGYAASRGVVLNTGTAPAAPPVDGLADTPFWTNRDILRAADLPASMVVIGGGAIGVELAQAFARFGTRVSSSRPPRGSSPSRSPRRRRSWRDALAADGIQVLAGASIRSVRARRRPVHGRRSPTPGVPPSTSAADRLLVAAGRRPNLSDIGLDTVGLDPSARSVRDRRADAGRRPAVGDRRHHRQGRLHAHVDVPGDVALRDILERTTAHPEAEYHAVPRVTFTDPEVGSVGLSEKQARDAGLDVAVGLAPLEQSTRGWIHAAGGEGVIKLVEDRGGRAPRRRHRRSGRRAARCSRCSRPPCTRGSRRPPCARCPSRTRPSTGRSRPPWPTSRGERGRRGARRGRDGGPAPRALPPARPPAGTPRTTDRWPSATARPTASRAPCARCSSCSTCGPGQRVLDVGSGSGWTTALLAELVGPTGWVLGVERVPDLVERGGRALDGVRDAVGPGARRGRRARSGHPTRRPSTASSCRPWPGRLPEPLVAQLAPHGVMVVPVGSLMTRVALDPAAPGGRLVTTHGLYRFVPLVE